MEIKSKKISSNLTINKLELDVAKETNFKPSGKNVIFAIDVSGSMFSELPKIRQQLKNKIPDLISNKDTISIIWFSGRNQSGVLKEGVQVKNLTDLQKLNDAIDRFLVPMGCTAFLPPIKLAKTVINNLSNNGNYFSFIFLSDGYNNDSVWGDVISELKTLDSLISNATFIEYGYYADSDALTEMSEVVGGEKIFSKDFDSYDEQFSEVVKRNGSLKRSVGISSIKSNLIYQYLFTIDKANNTINVISSIDKDEILISEEIEEVYFLTKDSIGLECDLDNNEILAAAFVLAERLKYNYVEDILVSIGDIDLFEQFSGAYGKQKLNELKDKLKELTFEPNKLYSEHEKNNFLSINPNQYCFMDLIKDLQDGNNYFYPYSESFNYNRISSKKTTKVELTEEAKEALAKAKTLKEIEAITKDLSAPEFIYPKNASEIGFSFKTLVWNQDRANLSVQVKLNGRVKLPKNDFGMTEIDSFIYRNFTLVKDGILNVTEIPVKLDAKTFSYLVSKGVIKDYVPYYNDGSTSINIYEPFCILDISKLPTINRSMTKNVSAKSLANLEFDLVKCQAQQKYLKYIKDIHLSDKTDDSLTIGPKEFIDWLKDIGITETGGFNPKVESVKSEDFYVAPVLKTKIEKMSSIPKISDINEKIKNSKNLNIIEGLTYRLGNDIISKLNNDSIIEDIENNIEDINNKRRECLTNIAKIKFGIILSRSWFSEFESLNENTLDVKFDDVDCNLKVTFDYKDTQIKL